MIFGFSPRAQHLSPREIDVVPMEIKIDSGLRRSGCHICFETALHFLDYHVDFLFWDTRIRRLSDRNAVEGEQVCGLDHYPGSLRREFPVDLCAPTWLPSYLSLNVYPTTFATLLFGIVLNLILPGEPGYIHRLRRASQHTNAGA